MYQAAARCAEARAKSPCVVGLTSLALLLLLAGCGGGGGGGGSAPVSLGFTTFQPASMVIGQPDFTSGTGATAADRLMRPIGPVCAAPFFIPDSNNHRVLGYYGIPTYNGAAANFVLGQTDFVSSTYGHSATKMRLPWGIAAAGGKLFVGEWTGSRVLIWNVVPVTTNTPADLEVGDPDLVTSNNGPAQSLCGSVAGVAVAGGRLVVADQSNNRVLIWNTIPTTSGAPADLVLGQPDFTSRASGTAATEMLAPAGLWTDGTRLVVAEQGNNRVLIWNTFPTTIQQPADVVLGQPDFGMKLPRVGPDGMAEPIDVTSDGVRLFVCDMMNQRILIYETFPTTNGAAADKVLGQGDFHHVTPNDADQDGTMDPTPSARTFRTPTGVRVASGGRLLVTDTDNSRVLVFQGS